MGILLVHTATFRSSILGAASTRTKAARNAPVLYHPSSKQWETAVDSLDDVLVLVDDRGLVLRANRGVETWGLSRVQDILGQHHHDLIHPGCDGEDCYLADLWRDTIESGRYRGRLEVEVSDDLLERFLHVSVQRVADGDDDWRWAGARPHALLVLRDITDLQRRKELETRITRFEALQIALRGLAHEIGNPLAAMRTSLEVLQENADTFSPEKVDSYIDRILESTERLQAILERTVHTESQLGGVRMEPVTLDSLLRRMERLFTDSMASEDIDLIVVRPDPGAGPILEADPTATEEILINLLKNAAEAVGSGGRVEVDWHATDQGIEVTVTDDGPGMVPDVRDSLFQPFFSTKPTGLGIGLSYSNYLMNRMGGSLHVDSTPGRGTRMSLRFQTASRNGSSLPPTIQPGGG